MSSGIQTGTIETRIPGRLDRLPWSRFGKLVETGKEVNVFYGYLVASVVMIAAGVIEWLLGVDAEQKSLEDVAAPLTAEEAKAEAPT